MYIVQFQKISILPPQKELEFPGGGGEGEGGGGGSASPNNLKKYMKLNWNFQKGKGLRKIPFHGGGMDVFWNYTLYMELTSLK